VTELFDPEAVLYLPAVTELLEPEAIL
jgi:hypothetical protein